jgi:hypothetical protein
MEWTLSIASERCQPAPRGTNTSGTGQDALSVMAESIWSEFIRRCYAGEGYSTNDHRSELDVTRMNRLHVTQDDAGYWMLSLEEEDGSLKLLAHQFPSQDLLLNEVTELTQRGALHGAEVVADPPAAPQAPDAFAGALASAESRPAGYTRPEPKRARGA